MGEVKKPWLIDANDLLALVKKNAPFIYSILAPIALLCPAIEAEPVRHGKWIVKKTPIGTERECSLCGKRDNPKTAIWGNYCWFCGGKMDLEE